MLAGADGAAVDAWAVHAGGRSILDAVERAMGLPAAALAATPGLVSENVILSVPKKYRTLCQNPPV